MMIAQALPSQRRGITIEPIRPIEDPIAVEDVTAVLRAVSDQMEDVAKHFHRIGRFAEWKALRRVSLELTCKSLWFRATGQVNSTKTADGLATALRCAATIDRPTLLAVRKVLDGKTPTAAQLELLRTLRTLR